MNDSVTLFIDVFIIGVTSRPTGLVSLIRRGHKSRRRFTILPLQSLVFQLFTWCLFTFAQTSHAGVPPEGDLSYIPVMQVCRQRAICRTYQSCRCAARRRFVVHTSHAGMPPEGDLSYIPVMQVRRQRAICCTDQSCRCAAREGDLLYRPVMQICRQRAICCTDQSCGCAARGGDLLYRPVMRVCRQRGRFIVQTSHAGVPPEGYRRWNLTLIFPSGHICSVFTEP